MDDDPRNSNQISDRSNTNSMDSLNQERATKSNAIEIPSISLPKGGGALKGIDEKFEVNSANGTAGISIPLPISPGRNGFSPSLSLSYNSGAGNGPFGLGWTLGYPIIQRKTDKKLPRYREGWDEDTFMFSGAEDLVPYLEKSATAEFIVRTYTTTDGIIVKRYRPRIEGGFARIEKIYHKIHGVYWKVTTRDNTATIFGRTSKTRVADPQNSLLIFQWLPEFSYDDKGNWLRYHYKMDSNLNEDGTLSIDESIPNTVYEKNRKSGLAPFTNTYLKRVTYGNRKAYYADASRPYDPQSPEDQEYFFELVLDYGEHNEPTPTPDEVDTWGYREDAFSSYRSGFEVRTNRLCRRMLMFHHFKEEKQFGGTPEEEVFGTNYLVRSLDLEYEPSSINASGQTEVTYLKSVTQSGYIRKPDGTNSKKSLPPMEFTYQGLQWNTAIKSVDEENIANAPVGLTNNYHWVDLYNEGISGILTEQGEGWYYKSNYGTALKEKEISFSIANKVSPKPSFMGLSNGNLSIQDLAANGEKQIVVTAKGLNGYFDLAEGSDWKPFQPFEQLANIDLQDPNIRMLDLNGDGQPELVMTEENVFAWYAADGKRGHLPAEFAAKTFDEEQGPAIVFADTTQSIFLADMCGDGLTDIVRIRNGELCYWANRGYGTFSAKISMANAPLFDHLDAFNAQYLHLADVSGTGATDLIYLGENKFKAFINLSGNAWSDGYEIQPFPHIDGNTRLSVIDLLGTGTSCIVWSSDLPANAHAPMRYIDLMDSKKPHVLNHYKNNLGKETTLAYKSSTHFYLKDKLSGKPWITKLPFPVQVIEKMTVEERITDVKFSTSYCYHHGYYDHAEREFRGFGRVEQTDSEYYPEWKRNHATNQLEKEEALYQKPVLTKSWFHTGAFLEREKILTHFKHEYWHKEYNDQFPTEILTIHEPELREAHLSKEVAGLKGDEYREALRACKGMVLRQEVFALDAPENPTDEELKLQMKPYSVSTHNCNIKLIQPRDKNAYGVFLVTESEAITLHYERDETDRRIAHTLNTKIDELGNILESASVVYGRNPGKALAEFQNLTNTVTDFSEEVLDNDVNQKQQLKTAFQNNVASLQEAQTKTHISYTQNNFAQYNSSTADIDLPHAYRLRLPYETTTYEVTGLLPAEAIFQIQELENILTTATEIAYHNTATLGIQSRLIEHLKSQYLTDDLTPLEFGRYDTLGLSHESFQLAFTPDLLKHIYAKQSGTLLEATGKTVTNLIETNGLYSKIDGNFWIRSGRVHLKEEASESIARVRERFYAPLAFEDPLGTITQVSYDIETSSGGNRNNDGYYLFVKEALDALDNKSQVDVFNYRTLSPSRMIDINANLTSVLVDELGLVKALAVEGNGNYVDVSRTSVQLIDPADDLSGIKEYTEAAESKAIANLFASSDFQTTDTAKMRKTGKTLLQHASTRFIYDYDRYSSLKQPSVAVGIVREEHYANNPNFQIQLSFTYSDGGGNFVMAKAQAEPGLAFYMDGAIQEQKDTGTELRWIGNGRTVLNNKGNPVKQYEPYFSTNFLYETDAQLVETGVTPILYYDALGRQLKTTFPNGTLTKVEFDSWKQESYDPNDTLLESKWYRDRINRLIDTELIANGQDPEKEEKAAQKMVPHANTPSSTYLDSLGRAVLHIAHNGKDTHAKDRLYTTFTDLDIEGNIRAILDSRGNTVMSYKYDMLGTQSYQHSMDAGERWVFNNNIGAPLYSWDSREHVFTTAYDVLHRPINLHVQGGDGNVPLNHVHTKTVYGEGQPNDVLDNLRGQAKETYDTAGKVSNIRFDFKGNALESNRRLANDYKQVVNWASNDPDAALEMKTFTSTIVYDALNRVTKSTTPDGSITFPGYNEANLLETVTVQLAAIGNAAPETKTFVQDMNYDEKGQRQSILYGNNVKTSYRYDPLTFRLVHLQSKKQNNELLQDLHYTYDPVGNISEIEDRAIPTVFFGNHKMEPISDYQYDAIYRLTEAKGREHIAQTDFGKEDNWNDLPFLKQYSPNDPMAWRNYTQNYHYDGVGNILQMQHQATDGNWTRNYEYETQNNRLKSTQVGNQTFLYPHHASHGFITQMPHLASMQWNFKEELQATARQNVTNGIPETTYYVYDGGGQRVRKITENEGGTTKKDERIYMGGIEIYRKPTSANEVLERITLHVIDDKSRIAMVDTRNEVNDDTEQRTIRYQLGNHLGSSALELDATAQVISYEEYHPYGTTAYQAKNASIKAAAKRYLYTGMERDEETGLEYHNARYYLPWLGRWLSSDPAGIVDDTNLYQYSRSAPTTIIDRNGHEGKSIIEETEVKIVDKGTSRLKTVERTKITIVEEVTIEGKVEVGLPVAVPDWRKLPSAGKTDTDIPQLPELKSGTARFKYGEYLYGPVEVCQTKHCHHPSKMNVGSGTSISFAFVGELKLSLNAGIINTKDKGLSGYSISGPTITILEDGVRVRTDTGIESLTYRAYGNDPLKGNVVSGKIESIRGDIKGGRKWEYDPKTGVSKTTSEVGIGAPWLELKYEYSESSDSLRAENKILVGAQEDVGLSEFGIEVKLDMRLQLEMTFK